VSQGLDLVSRRPHIIIATPGRLADLIRSSLSSEFGGLVKQMAFLVFDKADRLLLDPCFGPDLKDILQQLPPREKRITVLASATNTSSLAAIYSNWKHSNPFILTDNLDGDEEDDDEIGDDFMFRKKSGNSASEQRVIKKQFRLVETLDQRYMVIPSKLKDCYLSYLLLEQPEFQKGTLGGSLSSVIIFVSKCKICDLVTVMLQQMGIIATALHSGLSQKDRLKSLALFKSGKVPVLVTTDLGSRGLDIPQVQWVINYSLPLDVRDYVHQVGRTARAGKGGHALSLVGEMDIELLQFIESHTTNAQWSPLFKEESEVDDIKADDVEAGGARDNNSNKFNNSEVTMKLFYEKEAMKLLKRVLQAKQVASIRLI
jgi:ATP-dependent RNA helicase DDX49/DBP8